MNSQKVYRGAKSMQAAIKRGHRAQLITDKAEQTFNRIKERMQRDGTWDAYCAENGFDPSHEFRDTQC